MPSLPFADHSDAIASIVERVGASTLAVLGRRGAIASAVVWQPGVVVSAAHVFRRTPAAVSFVGAGGRTLAGTLAGIDSSTDLAVFRLADPAAGEGVPTAATTVDGASVKAGHFAIAVGRAGDGDPVASAGLVNRVGGPWQTWLGGRIDRLVRLDGGVYDGLSGAPVADASSAVIGIATAALSRSYGIVVPTPTVARVVAALLERGEVERPWLGIGAQPVAVPNAPSRRGLLVTSLAAGGPAERAGVLVGDIVAGVVDATGDRSTGGAVSPAQSTGERSTGADAAFAQSTGERSSGDDAAAAHSTGDRSNGAPTAPAQSTGDLGELRQALAAHVGGRVTLSLVRGGAPLELPVEVGRWPTRERCC